MKVALYAAISADGFIATVDGGTDWVNDWELFTQTCQDFGCIVMGRRTFEEGGSIFDGVQHIVLSTQAARLGVEDVHMAKTPEEAVQKAEQLGFDKLLVIGGGQTNGSFMHAGRVQELFLDLHPLILGKGVKVFEGFDQSRDLKLLACEKYTGFVRLHYRVT
jgi:dihydrofolate reductase